LARAFVVRASAASARRRQAKACTTNGGVRVVRREGERRRRSHMPPAHSALTYAARRAPHTFTLERAARPSWAKSGKQCSGHQDAKSDSARRHLLARQSMIRLARAILAILAKHFAGNRPRSICQTAAIFVAQDGDERFSLLGPSPLHVRVRQSALDRLDTLFGNECAANVQRLEAQKSFEVYQTLVCDLRKRQV
jgi:hypothetical protein